MMHVTIIAVGRLKKCFWADACAEYMKRLKAYARVDVRELPDIDPAKAGGDDNAVAAESRSICSAIDALSSGTAVILMDIQGKQVSSESIAGAIEQYALDGINDICLIIGGSTGVDASVRNRAQARWSLGRITLPHNLARVVVLEQLYRAFKIIKREPYHK